MRRSTGVARSTGWDRFHDHNADGQRGDLSILQPSRYGLLHGWRILGFAGLVALHVFMLAGHGRSHDAPMGAQVMTAHASSSPWLSTPLPGNSGGAGMDMTVACLAVLAGLLLLLPARKGQPATVGGGSAHRHPSPARPERAGPRTRSLAEPCLSLT